MVVGAFYFLEELFIIRFVKKNMSTNLQHNSD